MADAKAKMLWNGAIRSVSLAYMNLNIAACVQLLAIRRSSDPATASALATVTGTFSFLFGYFLFALIFLIRNRDNLDSEEIKAKWQNFYPDVSLRRSSLTILYYPFFILRRLLFLVIPVVFLDLPCQQLQLLLFMDVLYVMFFIQIWSYVEKSAIYLEIGNEVLQGAIYYHMLLFTPFVVPAETRYGFGSSFAVVVLFIMALNIAYAVGATVVEYRRTKKLG